MAKKIKFALEMNGVKIRTMEELQENFDLDAAVQYLLDGKLLTWLDDRLYDEAEQIAELDKNAPDMKAQLCEILGVEYEDDSGLDVYDLERLNEKKRILKTMTDDEEIIANADKTALNQEDLADLLNAGEDTIYLCGESFNVPVKFDNRKYIGILGKPKVKIKATVQSELDDKGIIFTNVMLPWQKANNNIKDNNSIVHNTDNHTIPLNIIKTLLKTYFQACAPEDFDVNFKWWLKTRPKGYFDLNVTNEWNSNYTQESSNVAKKICLKTICQNQYTEDDILHMHIDEKLSYGWALTNDSFCTGGRIGTAIILYKDIVDVSTVPFTIATKNNIFRLDEKYNDPYSVEIYSGFGQCLMEFLLGIRDFIHGPSPITIDTDQATRDCYSNFLLGKEACRTIKTNDDIVIIEKGAKITESDINNAYSANKIVELAMNTR